MAANAGYYALRVFTQAIITIFIITVMIFGVTQALPGDVATVIAGRSATPEVLATIRDQLGLDRPLLTQYADWITGVLQGDFGTSMVNHNPVLPQLVERATNTFVIAGISIVVVVIVSIILGMYSAWRRDRAADRIIFGASVVGNAVPDFLVGAFLVFALATYWLHWLPAVATISPGELPWTAPKALIMPCLTMIIPGAAYLSRLVRAGFIDILDSPYIRMAMLKGIRPRAVLFRHALPNALSAAVPAFSLVAAIMMGAVVVVEFLFNYPGVGGMLLTSITTRDLPMLQAAGLLIGVVVYLLNLLADVLSRRFSV